MPRRRRHHILDLLSRATACATDPIGSTSWDEFSAELRSALTHGGIRTASDLDTVFAPLAAMPLAERSALAQRLAEALSKNTRTNTDPAMLSLVEHRIGSLLGDTTSDSALDRRHLLLSEDDRLDLLPAPLILGLAVCAGDGDLSDHEIGYLETALVPENTIEPLVASLLAEAAQRDWPPRLEEALAVIGDADRLQDFVTRVGSVTRSSIAVHHNRFWVAVLMIAAGAAMSDADPGTVDDHESLMLVSLLDQLGVHRESGVDALVALERTNGA